MTSSPRPLIRPARRERLDHSLHIGSGWNHHAAIRDHRERGFGIDRIVLPRVSGGDGVLESHRDPRPRRQCVRLGVR